MSRALAIVVLLAIASCSTLLEPKPDPTKFYVLTALSDNDAKHAGRGPALGIGPVQIPDYLDRPQLVTRMAPNRVTVAEFDRWAEPLGASVARILAQNLATLTDSDAIERYPWSAKSVIDYQIEVDLLRFEATQEGTAELTARWRVRQAATKQAIAMRESRVERPAAAADTPAVVAALSDCLAELSREIAKTIPSDAARR
jgi:uncharacterized lipoprotein YmbA